MRGAGSFLPFEYARVILADKLITRYCFAVCLYETDAPCRAKACGLKKEKSMAITVNLYYTGKNGSARLFAEEMESSGTADLIRSEDGNLRYEYFVPMNDPETVLLIDSWRDQASIDVHHASPMMEVIAALREKYDLHMKAERYIGIEDEPSDERFIRR